MYATKFECNIQPPVYGKNRDKCLVKCGGFHFLKKENAKMLINKIVR